MKGCFKKNESSGMWYARVDGGRHPNGKRRQLRFRARNKHALQRMVAQAIADIERGVYAAPTRTTMAELLDQWLASRRGEVAHRTYCSYADQVRLYLKPAFGGHFVSRISSAHVQEALQRWRETPRGDGRSGQRSARTLTVALTVLSMAFKYAKSLRLVAQNPMPDVVRPRLGRASKPHVTPARAASILQGLRRTDFFLPIWLAFTTGLRRGELVALSWGNVDLQHGLIERTMNYVARQGHRELKDPKTEKSQRSVPLSTITVKLLEQHRSQQAQRLRPLGYTDLTDIPVFDNGIGELMHPDSFSTAYRRALKKAGIPHIRLHGTRHGFSSIASTQNVQRKIISDILGHESAAFTEDYYTFLDTEVLRQGVDAVSNALVRLMAPGTQDEKPTTSRATGPNERL